MVRRRKQPQTSSYYQTLTRMSDEDLMVPFQAGTIEAFDILVSRYRDPLMNYVYRFLGDMKEGEDKKPSCASTGTGTRIVALPSSRRGSIRLPATWRARGIASVNAAVSIRSNRSTETPKNMKSKSRTKHSLRTDIPRVRSRISTSRKRLTRFRKNSGRSSSFATYSSWPTKKSLRLPACRWGLSKAASTGGALNSNCC